MLISRRQTSCTMGRATNGRTMLTLILFGTALLSWPTLGQVCDFDSDCDWTLKTGFILMNSSDFIQYPQYNTSIIQETKGNIAFIDGSSSLTGRIRGGIVNSDSSIKCLKLAIFVGGTDSAKGHVTISAVSRTRVENFTRQLKDLNRQIWQDVTSRPLSVSEKYRINIDIQLEQNGVYVAVDNITVLDCATAADDNPCDDSEYACSQSECIPLSHVCNLNQDCTGNQDEANDLCGVLPDWSRCTFETGLCGWHNVEPLTSANWTIHRGLSPAKYEGPQTDHTTRTEAGYYIYVEGQSAESFNDVVLQSAVYPAVPLPYRDMDSPTYGKCKMRFFYHMYGRDVGGLSLVLVNECGPKTQKYKTVWEKSSDQGQRWLYAEVDLTPLDRYSLRFIGFMGFLDHGDIAIDDISFSPECFGFSVNQTKLTETEKVGQILTADKFWNDTNPHCIRETDTDATTDELFDGRNSTDDPESTVPNVFLPTIRPQIYSDTSHTLDIGYVIIIVAMAIVLSVAMGTVLLCVAVRKKKERQLQSAHLEMVSNESDEACLHARVQPSGFDMQMRCAVTELNPNYDFITAKFPEQQLREIPRNKLTLLKQLGQGAFGEVFEGRLRNMCANVTELPVAVKTLPALSTEQAEMDFVMEAIIIGKFMHKNVVKCLGVCFEEHPRYIVLELLKGGDLRSFLRDSRPKKDQPCLLTMEELLKLALDVAHGCRHLEEKHFVHRDIAARNCLLTSREISRTVKIADFGMSRDIYSADYYRKGGKAMLPIKWMPPEAFLDGVFTTKTDVWSFGVVLWEIFTLGYMPYPGQTNNDVMQSVAAGGRLDLPHNCPARLNKIMLMCWNSIPEIRPSFNEIIEHLDMCLQDPEVMGTDPAKCHVPVRETFKDASILVKPEAVRETQPTSLSLDCLSEPTSLSLDCLPEESNAQFSRHMESQSREPLLPSPETDEC